NGHSFYAERFCKVYRRICRIFVADVIHDDVRTAEGEEFDNRGPDASRSAGNDGDAILQPEYVFVERIHAGVVTEARSASRALAASFTNARNRRCESRSFCQPISGCHWTATMNLSGRGSSRASTTPSVAHAVATRLAPTDSIAW